MSQFLKKTCVSCSKPSTLLCCRCFDSYCSIECQKADWQEHRSICFKMPKLIPDLNVLQNTFNDSLVLTPTPKTIVDATNSIEVTAVDSTMEKDKVGDQQKLLTPVKEAARLDISNLIQEPTVEPISLKKQDEPMKKQNEPIKTKDEPALKLEVPVVKVVHQSKDEKGPEKKHEQITKAAVPELKKLIIPSPAAPKATITELKKPIVPPQVVKDVLKATPNQTVISPPSPEPIHVTKADPPQPLMINDLKLSKWPEAKNIKVRLLTALEINVLSLCEDNETVSQAFEQIQCVIKKVCDGKKPISNFQPVKGEVVLAMFEGDWYRAYVIDPDFDRPIVQFIEYGNMKDVESSEILPAPKEVAFDIYKRDFVIDNMPETLSDKQREILTSQSFIINNVKQLNTIFHCQIFGF